ncbi:MAG: rhodanese-related sulfurtransferase [Synechococcaceae cyanobacterium]
MPQSRDGGDQAAAIGGAELLVAAFYRFTSLRQLPELQRQLWELAVPQQVRGTILLAGEGVNGTVSGPEQAVLELLARLRQEPGLEPLEAKFSRAARQPFQRLKVRLKREIVSMGCPQVKPAERVGEYVEPQHWDALIRDPDTLVIDTRNAYEVAIGSFERAIDPGTESFRQFPAWVEQQLPTLVAQRQPKAIAMFCTGGIRCEKASAYLLQQGFANVHHLRGGILRYLEEMPEAGSSWHGECFVFDRRVALNHRLEPGRHTLCHACGLPLAPADLHHPAYRPGVSCHHCIERFSDADRARFAERQRQLRLDGRHFQAQLGAVAQPAPWDPSAEQGFDG